MAEKINVPCEVKDYAVLIMGNDERKTIEVEDRDIGNLPKEVWEYHSFYFKKIVAGEAEYGGKKYEVSAERVDVSKEYYIGEEVSYEEYAEKSTDHPNTKKNAKWSLDNRPNSFIHKLANGQYRVRWPRTEYEMISPELLK
ncbi:hypothetical protein ACFL08_01970 [Patescibacteria group bacterium]